MIAIRARTLSAWGRGGLPDGPCIKRVTRRAAHPIALNANDRSRDYDPQTVAIFNGRSTSIPVKLIGF